MIHSLQRRDVEDSTKAADTGEHRSALGLGDRGLEQIDGAVPFVDVDAGGRIASGRTGNGSPSDVTSQLGTGEVHPARKFIRTHTSSGDVGSDSRG